MATQSLIISNTSPTVEVYRIIDGANTYILAQDGDSSAAPLSLSIATDYSPLYSRIATALETIANNSNTIVSHLANVNTSLDTLANKITTIDSNFLALSNAIVSMNLDLSELSTEANTSNKYMKVMADNAEIERAMNVSDLRYADFNKGDFDQYGTVANEVRNPTKF